MDVGRKRRNTRRFIVLTLIFVMFDWGVVDRWGAKGAVFDAVSGAPIEDAWVFATFDGETPWLRIPLGPHPSHRKGRCMGTRVTRTDRNGRFGFDVLTFNRALANKSVSLVVFKPGFLATSGYSSLSSSLLGLSPHVRLSLRAGPGDRVQTTKRVPEFPWSRLPAEERTRSDQLFGTQITIIEVVSKCGGDGIRMARAAMAHALDIARTFDERERARAVCRYASDAAQKFGETWSFDCENPEFRHPVSADVLAVEAEIAASRKQPRQDDGESG